MAALRVDRVPGRTVVALVERQKRRGQSVEPGGHPHFLVADGAECTSAPCRNDNSGFATGCPLSRS